MRYSQGEAGCDPHATGMFPGPGALRPPGQVNWVACVSADTFVAMMARFNWVGPTEIEKSPWWLLELEVDGLSDPLLDGFRALTTGPCRPGPPPTPGNPVVYLTYDDILAVAPKAFWSGTATCPAAEPAGDACPPSVGNAIQIWVASFASTSGRAQICSRILRPFWYFTAYRACLRWRQVGGTIWDFDDETVNGSRVKGQNYGVVESGTGRGSAISHVYEYPSGFDPLRNCLRPCPGDALGPPLPGYPGGSPAFQVTVNSVWEVQLQQWFATGGPLTPTAWQTLDLRTLGAPSANFTASSLIPIPVVEYGASPP
jgi:hypothetical protein